MDQLSTWTELGQQLRVDAVRASAEAGSGHPTSSMSAADLIAVLAAKHLRYEVEHPDNPANDHLIFSKGHASPLVYALLKAIGAITDEQMLTFRRFGSPIEGHPTPVLPWVDVATGSLGQGLPIGVGVALAGKRLDRLPYRVWVLCGDSEMSEGSMWEAFEHAAHAELDNLVAIIDVNRLGQRGETMHGWDLSSYSRRAEAFGWNVVEIDGHDVEEIDAAYTTACNTVGKPTCIVARTVKGKGVEAVADQPGKHGKPLDDPEAAIEELGGERGPDIARVQVHKPETNGKTPHTFDVDEHAGLPAYEVGGDPVPTRKAYGEAIAALGRRDGRVVALDGEVSNSTHADEFADAHPARFFEMYIAEQQMVAAAVGMQVRGWVPFASSFAAFLSRAYDFIRMGAVSRANIKLSGSHAGIEIGEDGPSQMALEDLAAFRAIDGSTVVYPCDPNQTAWLVQELAKELGIGYMRTTRGKFPTLYRTGDEFPIGGSRVHGASDEDAVTLVGAGVTLHQALEAQRILREDHGIAARVIDLYSVKPADTKTLAQAARETGRIVVAEDHWPEGGLGDTVLDALAHEDALDGVLVRKCAVPAMPGSGSTEALLHWAGIDAPRIAAVASALVHGPNRLRDLNAQGQSVWIDNLTRDLIGGGLKKLVDEDGLTGVTSNPTIFQKAIAGSEEYDDDLAAALKDGLSPRDAFFRVGVKDIQAACDILQPVYDTTKGEDGYVSFELPPDIADDRDESTAMAHRLIDEIQRPNVMIKVPATEAGVDVFEELTASGVSVNVTLLFSVERYEEIAWAFIRGLERRLERGEKIDGIASVASFFVSRVDSMVDAELAEAGREDLKGKAAVANAQLAYQSFLRIFGSARFEKLAAEGARVQRPLWASTSTKDPSYPDTIYVDELIGPDTVNTMPDSLVDAARDHATIRRTVDRDFGAARRALEAIRAAGVDFDDIVERRLVEEGVKKFADSFDELIETIASRESELVGTK